MALRLGIERRQLVPSRKGLAFRRVPLPARKCRVEVGNHPSPCKGRHKPPLISGVTLLRTKRGHLCRSKRDLASAAFPLPALPYRALDSSVPSGLACRNPIPAEIPYARTLRFAIPQSS